MTFPSITNRGEFFSNHYLDAVIGGDLGDLRKAWDEAEGKGEPSARSTLKGAASRFFKTRATASEATGDRAPAAIEHLNDVVLQALGFQPNRQNLDLVRNTTDRLTIRAAATAETGTGRWLVAIDAGLAEARCRPELPRQEARQRLFQDALWRSVRVAKDVGLRALLVHARDEEAVAFYTALTPSFRPSPSDALHLYLPIRALLEIQGSS